MAVLDRRVLGYIKAVLQCAKSKDEAVWRCDPFFILRLSDTYKNQLELSVHDFFKGREAANIVAAPSFVNAFQTGFSGCLLKPGVDPKYERMIVALKLGFPHMPATTAAVILKGFGCKLDEQDVLDVYASYGQSRNTRILSRDYDFSEINRRVARLAEIIELNDPEGEEQLNMRYQLLLKWLVSSKGKRESVLSSMPIKRATFFYWWKSFTRLGVLGLVEPGPALFRMSKIGPDNEARLVIDKLQHPERSNTFYVQRLKTMGIQVKRDAVAKVFLKWPVGEYASAFISNLQRLEYPQPEIKCPEVQAAKGGTRLADVNFVHMWRGMQKYPLKTTAPGLFILWAYIEELGILPILETMGLTRPPNRTGYAWVDLLLFEIARHFFGISTASAACESEIAELSYFAHLFRAPCNDTLLNGLCHMTQEQSTELRKWLVQRLACLGLATGRNLAFDFHQIDQDVILSRLRQFGKGPSSKKKYCYTGFRPHIAWDIDQGTLLVAEFRKASARGPTTIRRFIAEHILPTFRDLFDTVYIDSEYTGKDVWNFILDKDTGMGADLVACLKQNPLVRRARDELLNQHADREDFWQYYDDDHVYGVDTFALEWEFTPPHNKNTTVMKLCCAVKKHVKTGKLRCFGSSKPNIRACDIFTDYSHRWVVENGIKDLIQSYFIDKCPGENPHAVDIHFLVVTICRALYRMIERDAGDLLKNADGTTKTLARMRETLFRQGVGNLHIKGDNLVISLDKAYTPKRTSMYREWFDTLTAKHRKGLTLLGGLSVRFKLRPAHGPEFRNAGKKCAIKPTKNTEEGD